MTTRIKLRRDTAANWLQANPILAAGEPGLETDTGKTKYGDGVTPYALLPHAGSDLLSNDKAITVTAGDDTKWLAQLRRDAEWDGNSYQGIGANSVVYDNAGNIVVTGFVNQNNEYNMFVAKYNPAGVCLWKKVLFEVSAVISINIEGGLAIDSNNNIIVSIGGDGPAATGLLKIDTNGNNIWASTYANGNNLVTTGIAVDSNDDIYISSGQEDPGSSVLLTKIARATGAVLWTKSLIAEGIWSWGASITVDYQNNPVITGYQSPFNENNVQQVVVAKFDTDGNLTWQKRLAMPDAAVGVDYANPAGISTDSLGNIFVTGNYTVQNPLSEEWSNNNPGISSAAFVTKLSPVGMVQWARRAGPGPCNWTGLSTAIGNDGDLYLAAATVVRANNVNGNTDFVKGMYEHNLVLARYNATTGDVLWQKYFNNRQQQVDGGWWASTRSIDVRNDKLVICGTSQTAMDFGGGGNVDNWQTGWLAQLSTDNLVSFDIADFTFVDSRVIGRSVNITSVSNTTLQVEDASIALIYDIVNLPMSNAPISTRTVKSKSHTWTFDSEGDIRTPAEGNIVLDQTELGYANFVGFERNYDDDLWFQSVVGDADGNTYAVGADNWSTRRTTIYKFDSTGKKVWSVQLNSGSGSVWDVSRDSGVYTITQLTNAGINYKVGDVVVIYGGDLGGDAPVNNLVIEVTGVVNNGTITTYEIQSGVAVAGTQSYTGLEDGNDQGESRPNSITIDPVSGNLVIVAETYEYAGNDSVLTLELDPESGAVLSSEELHSTGKDINPYDIQVNSAGVRAVVGQMYGVTTDVLAIDPDASSQLGQMIVGKESISIAAAGKYPGNSGGSDWYVGGTGIQGEAYITETNFYHNMPTTVTLGSNTATLTIVSDGSTYGAVPTVVSGGTNYQVGHKLKVLGSLLGGVDNDNDAIIIVTEATDGVIIAVYLDSGVAAGSSAGTYTAVASQNYQTGSGATVDIWFDAVSGGFNYAQVSSSGDNYTVGDIITISGALFAGSASPANDSVFYVNGVSGGYGQGNRGSLISFGWNAVNSINSEYLALKIQGYSSTDFSGTGTWRLLESKQGEAFIRTPAFQKTFGGTANDWFNTVAWQGTDTLFAAGASHNTDTDYDENIVVKLSSTGTVVWKKQLTHADYQGWTEITSIAVLDDGVIAIGGAADYHYETDVVLMYKLDNTGTLVWHKQIKLSNTNPNESTMAVNPATGDFIVATIGYNNNADSNAIYLNKFDRDGNIIWKRVLSSGGGEYFNWDNGYRALHIAGDKFFIAGNTYWEVDDYSNAFALSLPLDGTGQGKHGIWSYLDNTDANVKTYNKLLGSVVTHPIESQTSTNINTSNARYYFTDFINPSFPIIEQTVRNGQGGAIVFPDGTKQSSSAGISQQVKSGKNYTISLTDAGGHIFVDSESNYTRHVYIPYWEFVKLPVGFKFSIINRSNNSVYVYMDGGANETGIIYGFDNGNYSNAQGWYINGNTNGGNWVELIKVKEGFNSSITNRGDEWVIRGQTGEIGTD